MKVYPFCHIIFVKEKKVAHPLASLRIILYICNAANDAARHIEEAFGYSTSVNLDNSLVCMEYRNTLLGYDIYAVHIYCLRCERLFLFSTRAVESLQVG